MRRFARIAALSGLAWLLLMPCVAVTAQTAVGTGTKGASGGSHHAAPPTKNRNVILPARQGVPS
ncbi:MAG TPA: hypothetical protein VKT32_07030, partial [Chthonomonadaceae bacterium]|nr:hypothetical protein [Chthonomonadaceae bacterium]